MKLLGIDAAGHCWHDFSDGFPSEPFCCRCEVLTLSGEDLHRPPETASA